MAGWGDRFQQIGDGLFGFGNGLLLGVPELIPPVRRGLDRARARNPLTTGGADVLGSGISIWAAATFGVGAGGVAAASLRASITGVRAGHTLSASTRFGRMLEIFRIGRTMMPRTRQGIGVIGAGYRGVDVAPRVYNAYDTDVGGQVPPPPVPPDARQPHLYPEGDRRRPAPEL